jgi:malonyl CoA-acyl carrier protein transacylase
LTRHVYQPVRWRATIDALRARMGNPVFVEVGPLQVLARMLSRRWIAAKDVFALDLLELVNPAAWDRRLDEIHRAAA